MIGRWILASVLVVVLTCQARGDGGPPKVSGSYIASGEMVQTLEDAPNIQMQIAFEESSDVDRQVAAFRVWLMGKNLTFVENFKTNQTFRYDGETCTQESLQEWIETKSPPSLIGYEDTKGQIRFSLKQLFSLDDKYLKEKDVPDTFRGIAARKWAYEIRGQDKDTKKTHVLTVYAYWSDGSWKTSNSENVAPLGFIVTRMNMTAGQPQVKIHEQFINVFSFVQDSVDQSMFEPIQGVQCENRAQTLPFPDVNKLKAMAIHSEVIFPDELEIRYFDMWFDSKNKMLRMDSEPINGEEPIFREKTLRYESEMVIGEMGVVFRQVNTLGVWSCNVETLDKYQFDVQTILNVKLPPKQWEPAKIFGLNDTTYVYIGKTYRRDIPCHMFQGLRTDWPEPALKVKSLWEWCFSVNMTKKDDMVTFKNGEYGLVHAQVKVLESGDQIFYPKLRMVHHFYDVTSRDPDVMQATYFDISKCFQESERRDLQFVVDWLLNEDTLHLAENATHDSSFLQKWKSAIYRTSGIEPYTLRVAKVSATVRRSSLYVRFSLLAPHSQLPNEIKSKQKKSFDAEQDIRKSINAGKMFISYMPQKDAKMLKLTVQAHSLDQQIKGDFVPHSTPKIGPDPTKDNTQTTPGFSLRTEPDRTTHLYTGDPLKFSTNPDELITTKHYTGDPIKTTRHYTGDPEKFSSDPTDTSDPTGSTPGDNGKEKDKMSNAGHGPGTVATVSIAMLLVGITSGAAGIFVYKNGLPKCSK